MDRRWRDVLGKFLSALLVAVLSGIQQIFSVSYMWYGWEDYRLNREMRAFLFCLFCSLALLFCVQVNACVLRRILTARISRLGTAIKKYGSFVLWCACVLLSFGVLEPTCMENSVFGNSVFAIIVFAVLLLFGTLLLILIPTIRSAFLWEMEGQWRFRLWETVMAVLYLLLGKLAASEDLLFFGMLLLPVLLESTFTALLLYHLRKRLWRMFSLKGRRGMMWCAGSIGAGAFLLMGVCSARFPNVGDATPRQDEDGSYLIFNREGFEWAVEESVWHHDIDIRMTGDILLNDIENFPKWKDEPPEHQYKKFSDYEGTFDGNGYALVGYYPRYQNAVFERIEEDGCVKDLTLKDSWFDFTGEWMYGRGAALCYYNDGNIEHCTVEADVLGSPAGGIVVHNFGTVSGCSFTGRIADSQMAGGIAAWNYTGGKIENCSNAGEIRGERGASGILAGICGKNAGEISSCWHEGSILAENFSGTVRGIADNASADMSKAGWDEGETDNCYYLAGSAGQEQWQEGVYVLTEEELADIDSYLSGEKQIAVQDAGEREQQPVPEEMPGQEKVHSYIVQKGDCLWTIAEYFYGNGSDYFRLKREDGESPGTVIYPGEVILIPEKL